MSFFPYETISEFFEAEGDFPENGVEDPRELVTFEPTDEGVKWFLNEEGEPYPYPASLQEEAFPNDFHAAYASEEEAEAASAALGYVDEPCCYNSSRNFGTGEHEYGCPNY